MITVSIVTFHTAIEELQKCLQSLTSSHIECIFIIDNSQEDYIRTFCATQPKVEYIPQDNIGYGAAHNIAIAKSIARHATYHLVLNSDVYFAPDSINAIESYMDEHPDVGQLIPNTIYPNGQLQHVVRLLPTPAIQILRRFLPKTWFQKQNNQFLLRNWKHDKPLNVPFHMGCFMFFRKTLFWPAITIVHNHQRASYKNRRLLKIHIQSAIHYFNKWGWLVDKERTKWNQMVMKEINKQ